MEPLSKLEKFDKTLDELESQVGVLKDTSGIYKKMEQLIVSYDKIIKKFEKNNSSLESLLKEQVKKQEELKKSLNDLNKSNSNNYDILKQDNSNNYDKLIDANTQLSQKTESQLDLIRSENKQFYFDFEKIVRIKLDENKSEIKQLLESESSKIKTALNENHLLISQKQDALKNVTLGLGIASILLSIGILIKLFI